ncbi:hypothetical protein [Streptomyces sp. NPDC003635]
MPSTDVHQVICAYDPDNPADSKGFGPVASSLPTLEEVSLFKLAATVLRPPGSLSAGDSIAYGRLPSGQDLIVRRVVVIDSLRRENLLSQAVIGGREQFSPAMALGLDQADWPLGEGIARVRRGESLARPNPAELRRLSREGADRLRDTSRAAHLTEALCHLATWVLTEPRSNLSVAAPQMAGEPRAMLLGLVEMLSGLVPGDWTFSTEESAESGPYRLIVMPGWPRVGSPDYGRQRIIDRPAPDGPAHTAARLLVTRYQAYGLPGLEVLRRREDWPGMSAAERAESLRNLLTLHAGTTPHKELPAVASSSSASQQEYAIEGAETLTGHTETRASRAEPEFPPAQDCAPEPAPPMPSHAPDVPATDPPDDETRDREAAALVERLFQARGEEEREELLGEVEFWAGTWTESQSDIACLTAIRFRLGLAAGGSRRQARKPVFSHDPQEVFDLLIGANLRRREPALEWALFLRQECVTALTEPLRSVVQDMFDRYEQRLLAIHPVFFVVMGRWAIPRALRLDPPGDPRPRRPSAPRPRLTPPAWLAGRRRGHAEAAHRAEARPRVGPGGNADDFLLLGKLFLGFVVVVAMLLVVGAMWRDVS